MDGTEQTTPNTRPWTPDQVRGEPPRVYRRRICLSQATMADSWHC